MNKLDVLEDLLPGFQRFLNDLTTCRLSSALEEQVNKYNQNIQDYIEQSCTIPKSRPPDPPKVTNGVGDTDDFIAKQRELSRTTHTSIISQDDSYYNVRVGAESSTGTEEFDNFYEPPTKSPRVPTSDRPPKRVIDDDPDFYEEPDELPPPARPHGKSATMPLPSKQVSSEMEGSDSGGTFISFHSSSSSQPQEELQEYEDLPDVGNFDDGDDSWSSTDYEDYDEDEITKSKTLGMDPNANKTKPKADETSKTDKLTLFKKQHENDPKVDHLGILHVAGKGMTITKKSFGQWDKRYCVARDMHLLVYKSSNAKRPSMDLVLFGNTITFVGQEGRQQNVFSVSHPNRGTEMFSAETKEDADKWIEVLKGYATMGNELVPSTGYVEKEGQGTVTSTGDDITKKFLHFFKRDKKGKDSSPQLSIDEKGVLSGYINVMGAKFGDPKWRKKFMTIQKGMLECYTEDGDTLQFEFPLNGTEMMPAEQRTTKRKAAMKISKENETFIYVETLNHLDMGPLLKKFMEEMVVDQKKDSASTKQRGMVSSILRAFEKQNENSADQEVYDDVEVPTEDLSPKADSSSVYQNFKIYINVAKVIDEELYLELCDDFDIPPIKSPKSPKAEKKKGRLAAFQHAGRKIGSPSPKAAGKAEEDADSGKKDKKAKKKEKEKGKKDKKGKGKEEEVVAKEEEVVAKEEEKAVEPADPLTRRMNRMSIKENKFQKSDKSHLLDVDKLEIERKEVDARKREVTKRKIDLRTQKREATDPKQKELLDAELNKAQQEWSECSNRLAFINNEIERLTKAHDAASAFQKKEQMRMSMVRELSFKDPMMVRRTRDRLSLCATRSWSLDTASAEIARNEVLKATRKESSGSSSPGREVAERPGNVRDKLKMFQDMGNK